MKESNGLLIDTEVQIEKDLVKAKFKAKPESEIKKKKAQIAAEDRGITCRRNTLYC